MSKGFKLLRVEYIFTVLIPILLAIYLNGYSILDHLEIIGGFAFWAITGNILNDLFDMDDPKELETLERTKGYSKKELGVLIITSFILGSVLFINSIVIQPMLIIYLILTALFVILYCIILKPILVINWIILGISHIWLPYFIIKINANDIISYFPLLQNFEWVILASTSILALSANLIHEIIDKDAITKLKPKTQQVILWTTSIIGIIVSLIAILLFIDRFLLFAPFLIFPFGVIYMARSPRTLPYGARSIKDIGIIVGNLCLSFVFILILSS